MPTFLALLNAVLTYGPTVIPLAQKLGADVAAGRGNQQVTTADLDELARLAKQSGEDIYARMGITPPPVMK